MRHTQRVYLLAFTALAGLMLMAAGVQSCRRTGGGFGKDYVPIQATPTPTPQTSSLATPTPAVNDLPTTPTAIDGESRPGNPAAWGEGAAALVGRTFAPIYFEFDSAELDTVARRQLTEYGQWLATHPNVWLTLEGHTDSTGSLRYNYNLGMARALAVEDMLRGAGIQADRMYSISYGEDRPAAEETTPESMALNRRVEVLGFMAPPGVTMPAPVAATQKDVPQAVPAPAAEPSAELPSAPEK